MKINLKLRLKNKTVLLALITCTCAFFYQAAALLGLTVPVTEDTVTQFAATALNLLVALGIIVDPTTKGISDSERAQSYQEPN